jgi:hypothetical protein
VRLIRGSTICGILLVSCCSTARFVLASASFVAIGRITLPTALAAADLRQGLLGSCHHFSSRAVARSRGSDLSIGRDSDQETFFSSPRTLGLAGTLAAVFTASFADCFLRAHCRARTTPASSSCWRQVTTGPIPSAQSAFRTRPSGAFSPTATKPGRPPDRHAGKDVQRREIFSNCHANRSLRPVATPILHQYKSAAPAINDRIGRATANRTRISRYRALAWHSERRAHTD